MLGANQQVVFDATSKRMAIEMARQPAARNASDFSRFSRTSFACRAAAAAALAVARDAAGEAAVCAQATAFHRAYDPTTSAHDHHRSQI